MSPSTRPLDTRTVSGIIIGLFLLGIGLLVANLPSSPVRSGDLELFTLFVLPVAISLATYVRFADPVVWWEVALLAVWGAISVAVTVFVGFLATMDTAGGYPGAQMELLRNVAMFLAITLGLGVPYGLAGMARHEHPGRTVVSAFLAAVTLFVLFIAVAVGV